MFAKRKLMRPFFTDQYKRFFYPSRSTFSLVAAMLFALLAYFSPIPLAFIALAAACFFSDDIPLTPVMSLVTAMSNLYYSRKTLKAYVTLVSVVSALVIGALVGFFVLAQWPLCTAILGSYLAITYSSPFIMALGALLGGVFAHTTGKLSAFWAVTTGLVIGSLLPIALPIVFELVFISAVVSAFCASVLTKQVLRLYHYCRYGASNADGYAMDCSPSQQQALMKNRAQELGMAPEVFTKLTTYCRKKVHDIKSHASLWQEFSGERRLATNSFKDIYHALMRPHTSRFEIRSIKNMLVNTHLKVGDKSEANQKIIQTAANSGHLFRVDDKTRLLLQQTKVTEYGGIPSKLLRSIVL